MIESDWIADSKGAETMNYQNFVDAMFELAEIWVPELDAAAYSLFFRNIMKRMLVKEVVKKGGQKIRIRPKVSVRFSQPLVPLAGASKAQSVGLAKRLESKKSFALAFKVHSTSGTSHTAKRVVQWKDIEDVPKGEAKVFEIDEEVIDSLEDLSEEDAVQECLANLDEVTPFGGAVKCLMIQMQRTPPELSQQKDGKESDAKEALRSGGRFELVMVEATHSGMKPSSEKNGKDKAALQDDLVTFTTVLGAPIGLPDLVSLVEAEENSNVVFIPCEDSFLNQVTC